MGQDAHDKLESLIFATLNLRYLRGLSMLPMGLWMALFPLLGHMTRRNSTVAAVGLLVASVLMVWATRRINRYYDSYYGRVEVRNKRGFPGTGIAVWGAVFIVLVIQSEYGVPAVALWLAALFFGIYMSSSGYRWFYLVLTLVFAALTPYWVGLRDFQSPLLGLAFAVAGVMDHLLLRKLLPEHGTGSVVSSVA